jgi:phenylacetyl-CoA:acceptor oxidoreductase 26-kDa subunit
MINLEIVPPYRQRSWKWPVVINLTFGGAGAGLYVLGVLFAILGHAVAEDVQLVSFQLLAPIIVCCGLLALSLEAGRPMRAFRLFGNLSGSWMSVESLAGGIFIVVALVNRFSPYYVLTAIAAVSALIFMLSQGLIVYRAAAVPAWNIRLTPVIFATSGFMTACGLFLLNTRIHPGMDSLPLLISLIWIFLNLVAWFMYLYRHRDDDFQKAVKLMHHPVLSMVIVGIGHLVPFVILFFVVVFRHVDYSSALLAALRALSGLAMIVGGLGQKAGIILTAGYYRGVDLNTSKDKGKVACLS